MKRSRKGKWLFTAIFLLSLRLPAQDIPGPMEPYRLVNDFAGIFSPAEREGLEQKLRAYHDSTSTQIYVVVVDDLGGYPASDYAFRLGEKWGVGQKGKDNGAVILVKPKIGNSRGQAFIATGYGLEARINDAYAGRIIDEKMIPYFIDGDYFGGVNAAVDAMIARLSGEFSNEEDDDGVKRLPFFVSFIILAGIIFFFILLSKGGDRHSGSGGHGTNLPPTFFPPLGGGRRSGGFGSGWGGSSGGFGGGGGGRFGGGGAGRSW